MLKNKSQFEIKNLILPAFATALTSATVGGIYFGVNSLRSIDNDPLQVKTDYKNPVKEVGGLKKPKIVERQIINNPKSKKQALIRLSQLKKEGLIIKSNSKEVVNPKTKTVLLRSNSESVSSSLAKCINNLRRRNKDVDFQTAQIQNTMGFDRVCSGTGKVSGTNKNVRTQEILPYVQGEIKSLNQKYSSLGGKQVQVDNYKNGSIYYTRYPSIQNSQLAIEINELILNQ